jgi:crotonobetainyl-CoA:carnitine CoA-transferase CaiB-like acyl-CoA transferase
MTAEHWPTDAAADPSLPLHSVRVLDLSRILAGPFAAQLLGDLGADVIKAERPTGDETRRWGPPFQGPDAAYFFAINRNRRAITVDLMTAEGRDIVRGLASEADVVIENFLPHQLDALGLDAVRTTNPQVIWVSIRGAGTGGSLATLPGFDAMVQARSGLMSVTGFDTHHPTKVGVPIADVITGLYAAQAALAALLARRDRPERPVPHIEVPLLECTIAALTNQVSNHLIGGTSPAPIGNHHPNIAPYGPFETADRPLMIGAGTDGQYHALCETIGRPELAHDTRFTSNAARVAARDELADELEQALRTDTATHWAARMALAGVPHAPINTIDQALAEPHVNQVGLVQTVAGGHGPIRLVASPVTFDGVRPPIRRAPPLLGEHDGEINPTPTLAPTS